MASPLHRRARRPSPSPSSSNDDSYSPSPSLHSSPPSDSTSSTTSHEDDPSSDSTSSRDSSKPTCHSFPLTPQPARCRFPGRRLINGRIYDSELGVTCHWCRQKTVEDHVFCCRCTIAFCGGCLKNRHGEMVRVQMQKDVEWVCPKCRGGCGRGCVNCCNCGPCRKSQGLEPTGLLVHTARAASFDNVHDYLVHLKTGESKETLFERKQGKGWCRIEQMSHKKQKIENVVSSVVCKMPNVDRKSDHHEVSIAPSQPSTPAPPSTPAKVMLVQPKSEPGSRPPAVEVKKLASSPLGTRELGARPLVEVKVEEEQLRPLVEVKVERTEFSPVTPHRIAKLHAATLVNDSARIQPSVRVKEEFPDHSSHPRVVESADEDLQRQSPLQRSTALLCPKPEPEFNFAGGESATLHSSSIDVHQLVNISAVYQAGCPSSCQSDGMTAAFSRSNSDAAWSQFQSEFDISSLTSSVEDERNSTSLTSDNSESPLVGVDNLSKFHFHVKEEKMDEENMKCQRTQYAPEAVANSTPLISCDGSTMNGNGKMRSVFKEAKGNMRIPFPVKIERVDCDESNCTSGILNPMKVERIDHQTSRCNSGVLCPVKVEPMDHKISKCNSGIWCPLKEESLVVGSKERMNLDLQRSKVICVDDDNIDCMPSSRMLQASDTKKATGSRDPTHLWRADDFRRSLEAELLEPFSMELLEYLTDAASHRKPVYKARETRQGSSQFILHEEGYSYLDHHPELAFKLQSTDKPEVKLELLRGFFFWLKHASTIGAFKPWIALAPLSKRQEDDDCVEVDGPDCEVLAVVCSLDEEQNPASLSRTVRF